MQSRILPLLVLFAAFFLSGVRADAHDFIITVVGNEQEMDGSLKKDGLPIVICPKAGIHQLNGYPMDQPSKNCFFVVIQNGQTVPDVLTMGASAWFECIQFKIKNSSGKVYTVEHRQISWAANPMVTWAFPSRGIRAIPVDFTNGAMEGWEGLPPPPETPEIVTMTATFTYYDKGKSISVSSKPTDVLLSSGN